MAIPATENCLQAKCHSCASGNGCNIHDFGWTRLEIGPKKRLVVMKRYKLIGLLLGFVLGLGAPVGSFLIQGIFQNSLNPTFLRAEVVSHRFFYLYMSIATPLIFAAFGLFFGHLQDRLA